MIDLLDPRRSPNHRPRNLAYLIDRSIERWEREGRIDRASRTPTTSKQNGVAKAREKRSDRALAVVERRRLYLEAAGRTETE